MVEAGAGEVEILAPYPVNRVKMFDVAHEHVDTHDVVQRRAGCAHGTRQVLAYLPRLLVDIAGTDDLAVDVARRHSGDEHHPAACGSDHSLGEVPAGCAQFWGL